MARKKHNLPEQVWEAKNKLTRVMWDGDTANLYIEVGTGWMPDFPFYMKINLNGFWHELCEFMRSKEIK